MECHRSHNTNHSSGAGSEDRSQGGHGDPGWQRQWQIKVQYVHVRGIEGNETLEVGPFSSLIPLAALSACNTLSLTPTLFIPELPALPLISE